MLLTVCVPEECVTVIVAAGLMTTLSLVPGKAPVLQFVAVFQSPLPPTQETVAAEIGLDKNRTAKKTAIPQLRSCLFIKSDLIKIIQRPRQNKVNSYRVTSGQSVAIIH